MLSDEKTRVIISLPKELKKQIEELAKKENRSLSNFIVNMIKSQMREQ